MREFKNNTTINLETEQQIEILKAAKILETAFSRKIHTIQINPNKNNIEEVYGIAFGFDLSDIRRFKE